MTQLQDSTATLAQYVEVNTLILVAKSVMRFVSLWRNAQLDLVSTGDCSRRIQIASKFETLTESRKFIGRSIYDVVRGSTLERQFVVRIVVLLDNATFCATATVSRMARCHARCNPGKWPQSGAVSKRDILPVRNPWNIVNRCTYVQCVPYILFQRFIWLT